MLKAFVTQRLTGETAREDRQRPAPAALALMQEAVLRVPTEVISLGRLAKRANVSPEHLCRLFQKEFGAGPLQYYRKMRLQRAAVLLERSNMSIKEIAYAAAFANPYHFSRAFRQTYGKSPRAFRAAGDAAESGDRPISGA
jgi:transcriptional regulator GlxA family with amidase domain